MNGIEKIKARIVEDSSAQREAMLLEAREKAGEITARYEQEAKADYEKALSDAHSAATTRIERLESVAQLDARKLRLAARQEMLTKAFSSAEETLCSLNGQDYVDLLKNLALKAVATGSEELVFSNIDRNAYGKKVVIAVNEALTQQGRPAHLTLAEESREFRGGLYVKDGNIETNCTFSALIRLQREQMAREVADILFD